MLAALSIFGGPRSRAMLGLVFASVAALGVMIGVLLGLAGGGQAPPAQRGPTPHAIQPAADSPTPTSTGPTERADSDVEPGRRNDVGYFLGSTQEGDGVHITFDRVQVLTGADATAHAQKHDKSPPASGILIVNENPKTRELVLAPDVAVLGGVQLAGSSEPQQIPLETLLASLADKGATTVLDVSYDELGYVTEVREKTVP